MIINILLKTIAYIIALIPTFVFWVLGMEVSNEYTTGKTRNIVKISVTILFVVLGIFEFIEIFFK